jgi:SP family general alpha glucoside:H+ symporter-like MFS transporter
VHFLGLTMPNNPSPLDNSHDTVPMESAKVETEQVEHYATTEEMARTISKGGMPLMRAKADNLTVWQSMKRYKRASLFAMVAAFSASLDGYRKTHS